MALKQIKSFLVPILAAALLAGCATADNVVFKALAGERPGEKGSVPDAIAVGPLAEPLPALGRTRFRKAATNKKPAAAKGAVHARLRAGHTSLKNRIFRHDDELDRLRRSIALHYAAYGKALKGFGLRKKKSLPPNDDEYRENLAEARRRLARVNGDLLKLNALAAKMNAEVGQARQLQRQVNAAQAAAAGAERAALKALASDIGATLATTHRMLAEIHLDISGQAAYTSSQLRGLDQLAIVVEKDARAGSAQNTGARNKAAAETISATPTMRPRSTRPLVRIRFATTKVAYQAPLYEALKAALAKRPDLNFEVVGIARTAGRRRLALSKAQQVMFSMAEMGVPPARVTISAATSAKVSADEVHLYVK